MKTPVVSALMLAAMTSFSSPTNAQSAIRCYVSNNGTLQAFQTPGAGTLCMSYQFPCTTVDTSCSSADVSGKTWKTFSTFADKAVCDLMKSQPTAYRNVQCCSTDLCNNGAATVVTNTTRSVHSGVDRISTGGLLSVVLPALALLV